MKIFFLFFVSAFAFKSEAVTQFKIYCDAREMILPSGCQPIRDHQTFQANFNFGNGNFAMAWSKAKFDPDLEFRVYASMDTKTLTAEISEQIQTGGRTNSASRDFSQADDHVYISTLIRKQPASPGDCNSKSFEMICMIADNYSSKDLILKRIETLFLSR